MDRPFLVREDGLLGPRSITGSREATHGAKAEGDDHATS
jgi:hypothetical protein